MTLHERTVDRFRDLNVRFARIVVSNFGSSPIIILAGPLFSSRYGKARIGRRHSQGMRVQKRDSATLGLRVSCAHH